MGSVHLVVGICGALVLLFSIGGIMEIESRAGPFEEPLMSVEVPVTVSGNYLARGPGQQTGPGGVCVPPGTCEAALLRVSLAIAGLPTITDAWYKAFLLDERGSTLPLGVLEFRDGRHSITHESERDARHFTRLIVELEKDAAAEVPSDIRVYVANVAGKGQQTASDLADSALAFPHGGTGTLRAAEIGAFSKSTTAIGSLADAPRPEGWTYRAWFESLDGSQLISLGAWEERNGVLLLDARVENTRLEDQRGILTTLEPDARSEQRPRGFPMFRMTFPTPESG